MVRVEQLRMSIRVELEALNLEDVRVSAFHGAYFEAHGVADSPDYLRLITVVRDAQGRGLWILAQVTDHGDRPLIEAGGVKGQFLAWVAPALLESSDQIPPG